MERFLTVLGSMSIQAAVVVLVVLAVRFLFSKMHLSKKYSILLWLIPYICMICPWKLKLPFSFWESGERWSNKITGNARVQIRNFQITMENPGNASVNAGTPAGMPFGTTDVIRSEQEIYLILGLIWLIGFILIVSYQMFSYLKLKKRLACCIQGECNIYYADDIDTAFVLWVIRPVIFLPSGMKKDYAVYVIEHEKTHIKRHDPLKKMLALAITCVHWFNPFAWAAFFFLSRDMEMACDEETVMHLGADSKKQYAAALLQLSSTGKAVFGAPLAFGEGNIKGRIKNIVKDKKTVWFVTIAAVVLIIVLAAGFLGRTSATVTLGSGKVEWITFPEEYETEVTVLYQEGNETKFVAFPETYGEIFIRFLEELEVEISPINNSRAETRPAELVIRLGERGTFCFDAKAEALWYDNGVKPTYSYEVADPESVLQFVERQLGSITEAVDVTDHEIEIIVPMVSGEDICGADGPILDYADQNIVIFHDYYGLFVYDMRGKAMTGAVSLEPIGCNYTQGENYCEVTVEKDGSCLYLHPAAEEDMYVYDIINGKLTKQPYEKSGVSDYRKKYTSDCIDPDYTVFRSQDCVSVKDLGFVYLESGSGMAMDLAIVVEKDKKRQEYIQVFTSNE